MVSTGDPSNRLTYLLKHKQTAFWAAEQGIM